MDRKPRRKELKQVAAGLLDSFISRNNDVAGYWGIGKLSLHAQRCGTSLVRIQLLEESMAPASRDFAALMAGYLSVLRRQLAARGLPIACVRAVTITLNFKPEPPNGITRSHQAGGDLFTLCVEITDDTQRQRGVSRQGYCWPHNPAREWRSARADLCPSPPAPWR